MRWAWVALAACAAPVEQGAIVPAALLDRMSESGRSLSTIRMTTDSPYCVGGDEMTVVPTRISTVLSEYPERLLAASGIHELEVCTRFRGASRDDAIGLAELGAHRILILASVDPVAPTVHHEVFHLLDYEQGAMTWHTHGDRVMQHGGTNRHPRPYGYVDDYAASNPAEDRAMTFEYLMSRPLELCAIAEDDRELRAKAALIWRFVSDIIGTDAFLRARVPCAQLFE
jgi:hypothetical protein